MMSLHRKLTGFYTFLVLLNAGSWLALIVAGMRYPVLISLGTLAYVFGLRHAVDADHIAAIDNTTRKLMQEGKRPLAVGFFFSIGHSTIVFFLTFLLMVALHALQTRLPLFERVGSVVGTAVSGGFLYLIAGLNLVVLSGIFSLWRKQRAARAGQHGVPGDDGQRLESMLLERGLISRLFRFIFRMIEHSWQMYFVGLLFGLGFETASEVALLGISSSATAHGMPTVYVLLLPLMFAAGMSFVDTSDGIFMVYAYGWAFQNPLRKLYYNMVVTLMSVLIAFVIGSMEWMQVLGSVTSQRGAFWNWLQHLDFGAIGYLVIMLLAISWIIATLAYKTKAKSRAASRKTDF